MDIEILPTAQCAAQAGARFIAAEARNAVAARGKFVLAASGGTHPWLMFRALVDEIVPWEHVEILQVDERVAPEGSPDRNLTHLRECLAKAPLRPDQIHPIPVDEPDLDAAAEQYARTLAALAGPAPVIDLVHLGLGPDGHTASLVPGDHVLQVADRPVAPTGAYNGLRRLTLTYPVLNTARRILWLVTGSGKAEMLRRLRDHDPEIPAGRVRADLARVLADAEAGALLGAAR